MSKSCGTHVFCKFGGTGLEVLQSSQDLLASLGLQIDQYRLEEIFMFILIGIANRFFI